MSAPEIVRVWHQVGGSPRVTFYESVCTPFGIENYVLQSSYQATLAERDKEIAELRAALNEAAQGFTNLVEIGALSTKNEEIALEIANKYRAIANGEPK